MSNGTMTTPLRTGLAALSSALAVLSATAGAAAQQVFYVDDDAPPGRDGSSWQNAIWDLQVALAQASAWPSRTSEGVIIKVAEGRYWPDPTGLYPEQSFRLLSGVTLIGGFRGLLGGGNPDDRDPDLFVSTLSNKVGAGPPTFTSGVTYGIVKMFAASPPATLDGFTVTGAKGQGGVEVRGQGRVLNCRIVDNVAYDTAGGVHARGGWLELRGCVIERNRGSLWASGGGIRAWVDAFKMVSCTVRGNRGNHGAGVYIVAARALLESCEITGNVTDDVPEAEWGVSAAFFADWAFGDIHSAGMFPEVAPGLLAINCTFAGNVGNISPGSFTSEFRNCIINLSSQPPSYLEYQASLFDCALDRPPPPAFVLVRSDVLDAGFVSPLGPDGVPATGDEDYRLSAGSLLIDAGRSEWLIDGGPDAAGAPRIAGARVDIGSHEFGSGFCPADFNTSGSATVQDIFDFFNAWHTAGPGADFNRDGRISPQDVYDYLAAWYYGCD